MIHLVGVRSANVLKVYTPDGKLYTSYRAGFDAWGNHGEAGALPPWGHDCWMPIGHYVLGPVEIFSQPIPSEGYGQIPIADIDGNVIAELVKAGKATVNGLTANIGGIEAPLAQLSQYGRSALFVHCGGSDAPDPFADDQGLYRTEGCTRMLNADWREFAEWLQPLQDGNTIVYTALETPADLGQ